MSFGIQNGVTFFLYSCISDQLIVVSVAVFFVFLLSSHCRYASHYMKVALPEGLAE